MVVYLGADHRGFNLKEILKKRLVHESYEISDLGSHSYDEGDDYTGLAVLVATNVAANPASSRGVLICGSGAGVDIVANKFPKVRSVLGISPGQVRDARKDDDVNILSLASNFTKEEEALKMVQVFLETPFSGEERYRRRLGKIAVVEANLKGRQ